MDIAAALTANLTGHHLTAVKRREFDWAFGFGQASASGLRVDCPWRILVEKRIAFTGSDDRQQFGLSAPLDGEEVTQRLLGQRVIERVSIRSDTGDLSIIFSDEAALEVLTMSCGYEGWEIGVPGMSVIALGGGELAIYSDHHRS